MAAALLKRGSDRAFRWVVRGADLESAFMTDDYGAFRNHNRPALVIRRGPDALRVLIDGPTMDEWHYRVARVPQWPRDNDAEDGGDDAEDDDAADDSGGDDGGDDADSGGDTEDAPPPKVARR